jgi:hypothetical protein
LPAVTGDNIIIDGSSQWGAVQNSRPGINIYAASGYQVGGLKISNADNIVIKGIEFPGTGTGIYIYDSTNVTIGGSATSDRNQFSCTTGILSYVSNGIVILNNWFGFLVQGDNFMTPYRNENEFAGDIGIFLQYTGNFTIRDNIIGEMRTGISMDGSALGLITNNDIGIDAYKIACGTGISMTSGGSSIVIEDNWIALNVNAQINLFLSAYSPVEIISNRIGTYLTKFTSQGKGIVASVPTQDLIIQSNDIRNNNGYGVEVIGSATVVSNFIAGNASGGIKAISGAIIRDNVIETNMGDGILLDGGSGPTYNGNVLVTGNIIGGEYWSAPNTGHGVHILNSPNNTIGGILESDGNRINYNNGSGIYITGAGSRSNSIGGNIVGSSTKGLSGQFKTPNGNHGIALYNGAEANHVGRVGDFIAPNYVLSSNWSGIVMNNSNHNVIAYNYVGTDGAVRNWGNTYWGIDVVGNNNTLLENTIAYNGLTTQRAGIRVDGNTSYGNKISENAIYNNGLGAIDLQNGANQNVLPPLLARKGSELSGSVCPSCMVEFFGTDQETDARYYLGSTQADGSGQFNYKVPASIQGKFITATTIDANNNSSALSLPVKGYNFPWSMYINIFTQGAD